MHESSKKGGEFGSVLLILAAIVILQLLISYAPLFGAGGQPSCARTEALSPHKATSLL